MVLWKSPNNDWCGALLRLTAINRILGHKFNEADIRKSATCGIVVKK